jgi:hypothetical protein
VFNLIIKKITIVIEQLIIKQLHLMPENLKQEVLDFVGYLLTKHQNFYQTPKVPKFGSAKGKYVLHPNFDEPLDDFKDYM